MTDSSSSLHSAQHECTTASWTCTLHSRADPQLHFVAGLTQKTALTDPARSCSCCPREACKQDGAQNPPPEGSPTEMLDWDKKLAAIRAQNEATQAKLIALNQSLGLPPPDFGNSGSSCSDNGEAYGGL